LFEFDQSTIKIFWVQEQNGLFMGPDLWLTIPQHTGTCRFKMIARRDDVVHLITHMMNATRWVFIQEPLDRAILAQRIQEFDFCIRQFDKNDRHAMIWFILWFPDMCAQRRAVLIGCGLKVWHSDGDVI